MEERDLEWGWRSSVTRGGKGRWRVWGRQTGKEGRRVLRTRRGRGPPNRRRVDRGSAVEDHRLFPDPPQPPTWPKMLRWPQQQQRSTATMKSRRSCFRPTLPSPSPPHPLLQTAISSLHPPSIFHPSLALPWNSRTPITLSPQTPAVLLSPPAVRRRLPRNRDSRISSPSAASPTSLQ